MRAVQFSHAREDDPISAEQQGCCRPASPEHLTLSTSLVSRLINSYCCSSLSGTSLRLTNCQQLQTAPKQMGSSRSLPLCIWHLHPHSHFLPLVTEPHYPPAWDFVKLCQML